MVEWYCRYVSNPMEVQQIKEERKILSVNTTTNRETWFTTDAYDDITMAEECLSLPATPSHNVGPVSDAMMPYCHISARIVAPMYGKRGGGIEVATMEPVWLCGLWDFRFKDWNF